jgi:hypothetical protein
MQAWGGGTDGTAMVSSRQVVANNRRQMNDTKQLYHSEDRVPQWVDADERMDRAHVPVLDLLHSPQYRAVRSTAVHSTQGGSASELRARY